MGILTENPIKKSQKNQTLWKIHFDPSQFLLNYARILDF